MCYLPYSVQKIGIYGEYAYDMFISVPSQGQVVHLWPTCKITCFVYLVTVENEMHECTKTGQITILLKTFQNKATSD